MRVARPFLEDVRMDEPAFVRGKHRVHRAGCHRMVGSEDEPDGTVGDFLCEPDGWVFCSVCFGRRRPVRL
jgi:hypothetical protein